MKFRRNAFSDISKMTNIWKCIFRLEVAMTVMEEDVSIIFQAEYLAILSVFSYNGDRMEMIYSSRNIGG